MNDKGQACMTACQKPKVEGKQLQLCKAHFNSSQRLKIRRYSYISAGKARTDDRSGADSTRAEWRGGVGLVCGVALTCVLLFIILKYLLQVTSGLLKLSGGYVVSYEL